MGLWFVGLGLVVLQHVGNDILGAYGGWNTFDIFFVQYCSMCHELVSVGWRSHTNFKILF